MGFRDTLSDTSAPVISYRCPLQVWWRWPMSMSSFYLVWRHEAVWWAFITWEHLAITFRTFLSCSSGNPPSCIPHLQHISAYAALFDAPVALNRRLHNAREFQLSRMKWLLDFLTCGLRCPSAYCDRVCSFLCPVLMLMILVKNLARAVSVTYDTTRSLFGESQAICAPIPDELKT